MPMPTDFTANNSYFEYDGKEYRNLPSQVQKNKDDIAQIHLDVAEQITNEVLRQINEAIAAGTINGKSCFIRYSANADGTGFTESWSTGKNYMGVAVAKEAPTAKSSYTWVKVAGFETLYTSTGTNTNGPMTQKATTDAINAVDTKVDNLNVPELLPNTGSSTTKGMTQKAISTAIANIQSVVTSMVATHNTDIRNLQATIDQYAATVNTFDTRITTAQHDAAEALTKVNPLVPKVEIIEAEQITQNTNIAKNKANISNNEKRIFNLEQEIPPSMFVVDYSSKMERPVINNSAKYAAINRYGGVSEKSKNLFHSNLTTGIINEDGSIGPGTAVIPTNFTPIKGPVFVKYVIPSTGVEGTTLPRYFKMDGTYIGREYTPEVECCKFQVWSVEQYIGEIKFMVSYEDIPYEPYTNGLHSAKVTAIKSESADLIPIETKNILPAIQALPDYGAGIGSLHNWIDWDNKLYHHNIKEIDLGDFNYSYDSIIHRFNTINTFDDVKCDGNITTDFLCGPYDTDTSPINETNHDRTICYYKPTKQFFFYDAEYTTGATVKDYLAGKKLVYKLAEPKVIDISDKLLDDQYIEVQSGGTVIFENEYNIDMPNVMTFQKRGS